MEDEVQDATGEQTAEEILDAANGWGLEPELEEDGNSEDAPEVAKADADGEPDATEEEETEEGGQEEDPITSLKAELDALRKQNEHAQKLIARQGTELGELRNLRKAQVDTDAIQTTPDDFLSKFTTDPIKAQKELFQRMMKEQEAEKAASHQQFVSVYQENKEKLVADIPNLDELRSAILAEAKADGLTTATDADIDISIAREPHIVRLYAQKAMLKKQLEEAKTKPAKVLNKVATAAKRSHSVTGKQGRSTSGLSGKLTADAVERISSAEAKKILAEANQYK